MTQRTGEPSCKQRLRRLLDEAIGDSKSSPPEQQFAQFLTGLQSKKIAVTANIQSTGRVAGLRLHYGIFCKEGIKASSLGKAYSWRELAQSTGFGHNSSFNTTLLQLSDCRIKEWIQHDAGGRKYASQINSNIQSSGSEKALSQPIRATVIQNGHDLESAKVTPIAHQLQPQPPAVQYTQLTKINQI